MKDIRNIVTKRILGDALTNEEESLLKVWIESNHNNILLLKRLETFELSKLIIKAEDDGLGREMSDRFINTVKGIEKRKRRGAILKITYAASVAAIIALSWLIIDYDNVSMYSAIISNNETVVVQKDIVRHDDMVQLITADKILTLDRNANYLTENRIEVKEISGEESVVVNEEPQINTLVVPLRKDCNFVLPDGSHVWINSGSKLIFPDKFSDTLRSVELIGEAYFEIKKNAKAPFVVRTKGISTTVLGTQFMISCYEDKNEVSLVEGSVVVNKMGSDNRVMLKPGRGVILSDKSSNLQEVAINVKKILGRKNGLIMYDEEKLSEIGVDLKHLYGVDFIFENEELKNQTFYLEINRQDNIEYIMQLLKYTKKIDYIINDDNIIIKPHSL